MKKISTLFKKDPTDMGRVLPVINPENRWVIDDSDGVICSRKFDGTSCAIIDGVLHKRYDAKLSRPEIINPTPGMEVVKRSGKVFKKNAKINKIIVTGVTNPHSGKVAVKLENGEFVDLFILRKNEFTNQAEKPIPSGAIPCQTPDEKSGHWPHWIPCDRNNPADKYHFEAFDFGTPKTDGTYELCGPKVQGNPENFSTHFLVRHGDAKIAQYQNRRGMFGRTEDEILYEFFRNLIADLPFEGVVFAHKDGRMCKLRKTDFGFIRD